MRIRLLIVNNFTKSDQFRTKNVASERSVPCLWLMIISCLDKIVSVWDGYMQSYKFGSIATCDFWCGTVFPFKEVLDQTNETLIVIWIDSSRLYEATLLHQACISCTSLCVDKCFYLFDTKCSKFWIQSISFPKL